MQFRRLRHGGGLVIVSLCALLSLVGCDEAGSPTDQPRGVGGAEDRNVSAIALQGDPAQLEPVRRIPRDEYGRVPVGQFVNDGGTPTDAALRALFFRDATGGFLNQEEQDAVAEGLGFFTTPHDPSGNDDILQDNPFLLDFVREGTGPVNNQFFCMGCHRNARELRDGFANDTSSGARFLSAADLAAGVTPLLSNDTQVARAARATITNFRVTSTGFDGDWTTGGRSADSCDRTNCDAVGDTGDTDAFTIFGDFSPSTGAFFTLEVFGGFVQHTRPAVQGCFPDSILPTAEDPILQSGNDPITGLPAIGLRRAVGERAGPPYVGRGLMEAIFDSDLIRSSLPNSRPIVDADDERGHNSRLAAAGESAICPSGDCVSGRRNQNTLVLPIGGDPVTRTGRFGLRAAGPTIIQFVLGGLVGELGFTNNFFPSEPANTINGTNPACTVDGTPDPDINDGAIFSCRNFIRMTAPPELGQNLRDALNLAVTDNTLTNTTDDCAQLLARGDRVGSVLCGALIFGVDPIAFRNRIDPDPGTTPWRTDNRDPNAINRTDQGVNCAGCHIPVHATGTSPAEIGTRHLNNKWIHLFSDLLIHDMGEIVAERSAPAPRNPLRVARSHVDPATLQVVDGQFTTLDVSRNLADDALPGQGLAAGDEWRTPPLWGMGLTSPPFFHDARVYLSNRTVDSTPEGTVFSHGGDAVAGIAPVTNGPLVIRNRDDAIRATIELHDLPLPDDGGTPDDLTDDVTPAIMALGGGCPAPNGNNPNFDPADLPARAGTAPIAYGTNPATVICPPVGSGTRSEARITMLRYRRLSPAMQQALINFLKEL